MKKFISTVLLTSAAAMLMTACDDVGTADETSSQEATAETTQTTTEVYIPEDEMPTERVKDIQSTDDYDYEIIDGSVVITGYTGSASEVEIPSEIDGTPVTKIGTHAFEANWDIVNVTLPEGITVIGEGAFMDCGSLETVVIPESVTGIDRAAFASCGCLTEITIPAGVQYIREEAFTACESMTSLTISNPDLAYENWGLEELPELMIYAPEDSSAAAWAEGMGKLGE